MSPNETPAEGDLVAPVTPGSETPPEPTSESYVSKADLEALAGTLRTEIETQGQRTRQSQGDVIEDRVSKAIEKSFMERLIAALPEGVDPKLIQREAFVDTLMADPSLLGKVEPEPEADGSPPPSGTDPVQTEVQRIMHQHGLSGQEPEIAAFLKANKGKGLLELLGGLDALGVEVAKRKPSAASLMPESGSPPPQADATKIYIAEMQAARGKPEAARAAKTKAIAAGVDISQVAFGLEGIVSPGLLPLPTKK